MSLKKEDHYMNIKRLRWILEYFINNKDFNDNPNYISILVVEEFLRRKCLEYKEKTETYVNHLNKLLKKEWHVSDRFVNNTLELECDAFNFSKMQVTHYKLTVMNNINGPDILFMEYWDDFRKSICHNTDMLINDPATTEYQNFLKDFESHFGGISSNLGLDVFFTSTNDDSNSYSFVTTINDSEACHESCFDCKKRNGQISISYNDESIKDFLNEELIGKMYAALKIDISCFPEKWQQEIKNMDVAIRLGLEKEKEKQIDEFRKLQIDRIMKAYKLIKEAMQLLNNAKMDLNFERLKIDNLREIIFKNNALPNSDGCIEFEDFFKNNMILKMLDLSQIDLTNVDIRGIDFSGTNIHIDPQTVFNKDMSYVNARGLKFSPFTDFFDDVIIDGAIITDHEANINLDTVGSYNDETIIKHYHIDVWKL